MDPPAETSAAPGIGSVPEQEVDRERLRAGAGAAVARFTRTAPPSLDALAAAARCCLESLDMPLTWTGFAMVCLNNAFWADAFAGVPPRRRMLLLPHCLAHPEGCQASASVTGLHCQHCGNCSISLLQLEAEAMGYQIVIAEGTSQLLDRLTSGMADAILGVACMDSLGRSYPRLAELGVPNLAVPLVRDGCRDTHTDVEHLRELMRLESGSAPQCSRSFVPLLRQTRLIFEAPLFDSLLEDITPRGAALSPLLGETDRIALDCLRHGGKRLRPFAVLASFAVGRAGEEVLTAHTDFPSVIGPVQQRVAIAIEALHRASLVHDDIEDHDEFRHGRPTLHQEYGVPAAINLGDHLIGLGYRMVTSQASELGASSAADMLDVLARSHMELARGQGAELFWQDRPDQPCSPADALRLYALKTSPAFESALFCGLRMAGTSFDAQALHSYCTHLGTAFQIANDLDDWKLDESNKRMRGRDVLAGRPTLLRALALESAGEEGGAILRRQRERTPELHLQEVEAIYRERNAFGRARQLLQKMVERSHAVAAHVAEPPLDRLLQSLVRLSIPADTPHP